MAGRRVHFVFPVGLVERVDARLGPGQSRGDFVRRAVEQALGEQPSGQADAPVPASAEQPEQPRGRETSEAERRGLANFAESASRPSREFRPYPKGGG